MTTLLTNVVLADQKKEYKKSINDLAIEIKKISQNLNANRILLKTEKDKLSGTEQEIINLDIKLVSTLGKIEQQKKDNILLDQQIEELQKTQKRDKDDLTTLIRERYINGEPNYLKMLLNQENPYAVGRLANYLDYFTKAQSIKIEELMHKAQEKKVLQKDKASKLKALEGFYNDQETLQTALERAKKKRLLSINTLESKVSKSSVKLDQLAKDRTRLNSLLREIAKQAEKMRKIEQRRNEPQISSNPANPSKVVIRPLVAGGFLKQRGRLVYPVKGAVEYRFGKRIAKSGMKAQGTFIATNGGQKVKSIFRGRVLFANYLKGYGLLLIIDHGDDHISLYGHNEVLYKQVGDHVDTNEVVSKTGMTGGLKAHGLYFEIRRAAIPVDPSLWCRE